MEGSNADLEILKQHLSVILHPVNSEAVQESSEVLEKIFKKIECVPLLMSIMINEEDQSMRQISCIYLRKFLSKLWGKLDKEVQENIKTALIERFQADPSPLIKKSIAGVIGSMCKILIPNKEWDQLFEFVMQFSQSENIGDQELALLLLSVLVEYLGKEEIKTHFDNISIILKAALSSGQETIIDFSITCIKNFAKATSNVKVLKFIQGIIPTLLGCITEDNEERLQMVFDCLLSLVEYKGLLTPHLGDVIEGAIKVANTLEFHTHTRERAVVFFEFLPIKHFKLLKKKKALLDRIITTLMKVACEPDDEYPKDSTTPGQCALFSIKSFSIYMHKPVIFPIIIKNINSCIQSSLANERKAAVELLGYICEPEACLDPIKDHIDEITQVIVKCLYDESIEVKSVTAETVGMFSENVSDFLMKTEEVIPALVDTLKFLENTDIPLQKALHALHSFVNGADYSKITSIMGDLIATLMQYLGYTKNNTVGVQKWTLEILSAVVIAADSEIDQYFDGLMEPCEAIYKNTPLKENQLKAQALDTIGHLAKAVGRDRFAPYLEYYTQQSLDIIQQESDQYSMRESAFGYLCAISKFLKDEMAEIIPTIVNACMYTINRDDISHKTGKQKVQEISRDSDSEPEEEVYGKIEAFDEKASALHCLGFIFQFCPKQMIPFVEEISEVIILMSKYVEDNVRFECISAMNGITHGIHTLDCGEDFEWMPGFENPTPIGEHTEQFLQKVYFPTFATVFETEDENDVIERMMQSLIEITEELGPAIYQGRLEQILLLCNNLLENKAQGGMDEAEGEFEDMNEEDEEEDIDHNEAVLANVTELISVISRVLGEDFVPYFEKTGELLFMHLEDNYPMRDKSLCIGTLAECFNNMPSLLKKCFNEFYNKIVHVLKSESNEELIRNCAFALGTCAMMQPTLMKSRSKDTLKILSSLKDRVEDEGAIDNIISALFKLTTYNFPSVPYKSLVDTLYTNIPLKDDLDENEHVAKCLVLLFGQVEGSMKPYMHNILKSILWAVIEPNSLTKEPVRREFAGWLKENIANHGEYGPILEELSMPLTQEQKENFAKFCPS